MQGNLEISGATGDVTQAELDAVADAQFIVAAADADLTAERVATNTATVSWDFATAAQAKASVIQAGIDHGSIGGLTDDDHSQYALLAGRAGGQTLTGDTASGGALKFESTAHATKGMIHLGATTADGTSVCINGNEDGITIAGVAYPSRLLVHDEVAGQVEMLGMHKHSSTAASAASQVFARSRGTDSSETVVSSGDVLGRITFVGHDGTDYEQSVAIRAEVDGTPGAGDMPGRLLVLVSPDGSATPVERLRIADGAVTISSGTAASELRLLEPSGSGTNYTAFKAQAQAADITYTLPPNDGDASQFLQTNGAGSLSWAASSGGGKPFVLFTPAANEPPTTSYATPDTRNAHPVLDFDGAADESAVFGGVLPLAYAAGGITVDIYWAATSATTGNVVWNAAFERILVGTLDIDADSFAAAQATTSTTNGTSGVLTKTSVTFTDGAQMDSLAAGEPFRLKITRDADNASDTMDATDAEVLRVVVRET